MRVPLLNERRLPLLVVLLMHAVLLTDVLLHQPEVGYDARDHLRYIQTLSQFRLPGPEASREFFAPPLPYLVPALIRAAGVPLNRAAKAGQLMNLFFSLGLCLCVLNICGLVRSACPIFEFWSLALLAIVPAYYKSFSMIRGEPLLSLLLAAAAYRTLQAYRKDSRRARDFVSIGVLLGLAILARQWAFLAFPAIAAFTLLLPAAHWKDRLHNLIPLLLSFAIAAAVGGWFYLGLKVRYGTVMVFNRRPATHFSFSNQPLKFYFGLGLDSLFTDPIRPAFSNEFIPVFYSEFWGDYECDFVIYARKGGVWYHGGSVSHLTTDPNSIHGSVDTNRYRLAPYIGFAQAIDLVPSTLFAAALAIGTASLLRRGSREPATGLLTLLILGSFLGYFCFLILYPSPDKGDTIKATFMLQVFPFLAILAANLLISIRDHSKTLYRLVAAMIAPAAAANVPLLFTRYVALP